MSETVTLAGWKTQIFESVVGFLPFWLQCTVLGGIAVLLLAYWAITVQEKRAARRAARTARPAPAPAGQGSGADHLGPYAPAGQGSGADHLGAYAPQQPGTTGEGGRA